MSDHLRVYKLPQYSTINPGELSVLPSVGLEMSTSLLKGSNALWLVGKSKMSYFICGVAHKTVILH